MSAIRFYYPQKMREGLVTITETDTLHKMRDVLRLAPGQSVVLFDGMGKEYACVIHEVTRRRVGLRVGGLGRATEPNPTPIALAFPFIKEDRVDLILQKGTEVGVDSFIPFKCERSLAARPSSSKRKRWERIVIEATRQSGRLWKPLIEDFRVFKQVIARNDCCKIVATIEGKTLEEIPVSVQGGALVIVGPEGDFSSQEYQMLFHAQAIPLKLSPHVLRVETAALIAAAFLRHRFCQTKP